MVYVQNYNLFLCKNLVYTFCDSDIFWRNYQMTMTVELRVACCAPTFKAIVRCFSFCSENLVYAGF